MDNEVPKQLNLSSNGITNESGIGEPYSLFGFSGSLVSRRTPSTWFLFLEYSRYPHPGGLWTPLSQSLIHSYFLGPQTSLRFYLLSCTYAMLYCFIYDCARSTLYCLGSGHVFAVSTSPVLGSQSFTAVHPNLGSVSESANFVAGVLQGVAPWNISESCDCFVVKASLGFDLVFPRLIECVLLFVHPCRVKLSESRVRGYGRLGAQFLDHRQA